MLSTIAEFLFNCLGAFVTFCKRAFPMFSSNSNSAKALPASEDVAFANYRLFNGLAAKARESLGRAIAADERIKKSAKTIGRECNERDHSSVISLYNNAAKSLQAALKINPSQCPRNKRDEIERGHDKLYDFLGQAQDRAKKLEAQLELAQRYAVPESSVALAKPIVIIHSVPSTSSIQHRGKTPTVVNKALFLKNVNSKFGEEILTTLVETAHTRLADVEGNKAAKAALEESVVLPSLNPTLFTGLRAPCKGILLFGPPGNGKTMIAKAVASESGCQFFNISAATIMSKWVGDGERMVQALFQVARNAQPSIIFIDEVDSMLCERSEQENGAARRVKTEFLIQLDGCTEAKSDDRVLVLAATNRPQELDEGILRRFPQRIFIDLPDHRARASMIRRTFAMHKTKIDLSDRELDRIATMTENYSYSDLMALCRAAALTPIQSVKKEQLRFYSADKLRPITITDLESALQAVKPSMNQENRRKLVEFAQNHALMST